ncbi:hypothetical protein [Streptomyces sp. NBC_01190]|uniref:hypothetical protein n=1 Tax=Streptomyces sp. NBC_01190 TaxID=2903767 RepID=UPI003864FD7F|nr:hypothetical protein OG519_03740 [Streptomyces sp. NBC_01190]
MSRRTITLQVAAVVTAVAAATAVGAGSAAAQSGGKGWGSRSAHGYSTQQNPEHRTSGSACDYSVGGSAWQPGQGLSAIKPSADGKISIDVLGGRGGCTVSLASYLAHGPDFKTSGVQVLKDFATVSVAKGETGTLTVAVPDAGCFAQIDLYKGSTKYAGDNAPAGPDHAVIGANLIASWNGPTGGKDCLDVPPTTAPASPTTTSPAPSDTATTGTPSASATETTGAPSASGSTTAAPVGDTTSPAAVDDTSSPSPSASGGALASTGGGGNSGLLAGLAVLLVVLGGGVTFVLRRRGAGRAH